MPCFLVFKALQQKPLGCYDVTSFCPEYAMSQIATGDSPRTVCGAATLGWHRVAAILHLSVIELGPHALYAEARDAIR